MSLHLCIEDVALVEQDSTHLGSQPLTIASCSGLTLMPSSADEGLQAWEKSGAKFNSKQNSQYFDPCQEAADRSLKCLRRNGGARDMCMDYFDAYRECKKQWIAQMKEEKRKQGRWF